MGDFVKATQDTLGKLIKKPPLTEKLLRKPPFRFLHDVITEVIRTTGFMKDLYSATEMDSQNVKDKESKIAFLQKAIDVIALVHKKPLSVKPSKIVAGHEPERTNELLQQIASAISNKLDSSDAVAQVRGELRNESESSKPPRPAKEDEKFRDSSADKRRRDKENREKRSRSDNRDRSSSLDREKGRDKESKEQGRSKDQDRHRDRSKDKDRNKDRDGSRDRERDPSKDKEKKGRDKEKERNKERDREKDKEKDRNREKERSKDRAQDGDKERDQERRDRRKRKEEEATTRHQQQIGHQEDEESEDGASINRIPRPTSAKGQRRRPLQSSDDSEGEEDNDCQKAGQEERNDMVNGNNSIPPQVQASRKLARPNSARPAPPRVKKQGAAEDPATRIGSGKQVNNVIVDNDQNSEDEDDTFLVEESQPVVDEEPQVIGSESLEDDGEHGGLVKKILETKQELEGNKARDRKDDKPVVMDAARRKERERVQREVEKLTSAIQTLTRSANPLGKIMDYLQEDVDSMQKELEMWKKENQEHKLAIKREQGITDMELEPLKAQLTELDQGIQDQLDTIATIKSNLLRGDEKIAKMVSTVAIS